MREPSETFGSTRPHDLASSKEPPALMVFQDGGGYVDLEGPIRAPAASIQGSVGHET